MHTNSFRFFMVFLLISMLGFVACEKSEEVEPKEEPKEPTVINYDYSYISPFECSEAQFHYAYLIAIDGLDGELDDYHSRKNCSTITHDEIAKTVTIDFGTNCVGEGKPEFNGKIIVKYRDRDKMAKDELIITFESCTINSHLIKGILHKSEVYKNSSNQWEYNLTLENGIIYPDASSGFNLDPLTWGLVFDKDYIWIEGINSLDYKDDVFMVTGSFSSLVDDDYTFTSTIRTPLTQKLICSVEENMYPISGIVDIKFTKSSSESISSLTLDYGNLTCDREVTITNGNQVNVVTLTYPRFF